MNEHRARVDEMVAGYRRSKEEVDSVYQRLTGITASAASSDDGVTSTVSSRGTLIDLVIDERAYRRYTPAQLAEQIILTTASASSTVFDRASALFAPLLPHYRDSEPNAPEPPLASIAAVTRPVTQKLIQNCVEEGSFSEQDWVRDEAWS